MHKLHPIFQNKFRTTKQKIPPLLAKDILIHSSFVFHPLLCVFILSFIFLDFHFFVFVFLLLLSSFLMFIPFLFFSSFSFELAKSSKRKKTMNKKQHQQQEEDKQEKITGARQKMKTSARTTPPPKKKVLDHRIESAVLLSVWLCEAQ